MDALCEKVLNDLQVYFDDMYGDESIWPDMKTGLSSIVECVRAGMEEHKVAIGEAYALFRDVHALNHGDSKVKRALIKTVESAIDQSDMLD